MDILISITNSLAMSRKRVIQSESTKVPTQKIISFLSNPFASYPAIMQQPPRILETESHSLKAIDVRARADYNTNVCDKIIPVSHQRAVASGMKQRTLPLLPLCSVPPWRNNSNGNAAM